MTVYLIRHGQTAGNREKRYIGRMDEPLCAEGIQSLHEVSYPPCDVLVCSPMRRCIQTAEILFPGQAYSLCDDLRECDFGRFEGKNYLDLNGDSDYQAWIDSGGTAPFPEGESPQDFRSRCVREFLQITSKYSQYPSLAIVAHGGTVMSILEALAASHRDYYDWLPPNGGGWKCRFDGKIITQPEKL